jgi:hypothetical protein
MTEYNDNLYENWTEIRVASPNRVGSVWALTPNLLCNLGLQLDDLYFTTSIIKLVKQVVDSYESTFPIVYSYQS